MATNFFFDGAKFDFSKGLSPNFQVSHGFTMGSQVAPSQYQFGAFYGGGKGFLHGTVDHEGSLSARGNYPLTRHFYAKFQSQLGTAADQTMNQFELDYTGYDYTANVKFINPSPVDATGILVAQYLQSLSKSFAVGVEAAVQHPTPDVLATQYSLVAKYATPKAVFTTSIAQIGVLQSSYWHKVNEQIELGTELQYLAVQNRREATCSLGAKWEFRQAAFRAQVDTAGRVTAVLEEKLAPGFSLMFTGDIDHLKGTSKFGMGMQLEN